MTDMGNHFSMPAGRGDGLGEFGITGDALSVILDDVDEVPTVAKAAPKQWGEPCSYKAPAAHRAVLKDFAKRHGVSMSAVIRAALSVEMEKMGFDPIAPDGVGERKARAVMLSKRNGRNEG